MSGSAQRQGEREGDAIEALVASNPLITEAFARELLYAAESIKANAYCPYSKFRVGAALLALPSSKESVQEPKVFSGVNVENASYPVGTCAERVAFGTAVASGYTRVIAVAVSTDITPPASPCGMCRQFMREFNVNGNVLIIMMGSDGPGGALTREFGELLPLSFGPEDLPHTDTARFDATQSKS